VGTIQIQSQSLAGGGKKIKKDNLSIDNIDTSKQGEIREIRTMFVQLLRNAMCLKTN